MSKALEDYEITYATNLDEIEAIRDTWEEMQIHPNSDIDHFLKVTGSSPNFIRPHVILLRQNGRPTAMAVGRIDNRPFALKLGYKKLYAPRVKTFTLIYGGLLGEIPDEIGEILFKEFNRLMKCKEVNIVRLNYLKVESKLYHLAKTMPGFFSRDKFTTTSKHWRMLMPETIDGFFQSRSRKHRYWLRRMERILNKDYPDEVIYGKFDKDSSDEELSRLFTDTESIAKKAYQRVLNVGFHNTEQTRNVLTRIAQYGGLRGCFIHVQGKPCAYWIGQQYKGSFTLFYTGYDPAYRKYELGTLVFIKMLENLCNSKDVDHIDFGFGDAPYKSRFGDKEWDEASVHIFASNFRGMALNILRMIVMGSHQVSLKFLNKLKLLDKVKGMKRYKTLKKKKA